MKWIFDWIENCRIEKWLRQLSETERQEMLEQSPYQAVPFQGEGYHIFLKCDPDYYTGFIASIGEVSPRDAEDWIIKRFRKENETAD